MKLKEVKARSILDSRGEKTIEISIVTDKGSFISSAPSGKSRGRFEARPYIISLQKDIDFINNIKPEILSKLKIEEFKDLREVEGLVSGKIGANSLFALEAAVLKALAKEQGKQLWQLLSKGKPKKFPVPVGNAVGGGMHSSGKKPDFQEFLFLPFCSRFSDAVALNKEAYNLVGKRIKGNSKNDEGAWQTSLDNEKVLKVMREVTDKLRGKMEIGVDIAASSFFKGGYKYNNKKKNLSRGKQVNWISLLSRVYNLYYIEDPLCEGDFPGFSELMDKLGGTRGRLIVGDDLTVTNLMRLKKAVQSKSINALIVKPNQQGSLLKVKEICDFCLRKGIKIVFSHRSGETMDNVIADLAVAWKADFLKAGIFEKERECKLKRVVEIERSL